MSEPDTIPRIDPEPGCATARGVRLRSLIRVATPPTPATKLLFVLLVLVVAMWGISYVRELNVTIGSDGFAKGTYFIEHRRGAVYLVVEDVVIVRGVDIYTFRMGYLVDDCAEEAIEHVVAGVAYRSGAFGVKVMHMHHWLIATLIALPLAILWLRQVIMRRSEAPS